MLVINSIVVDTFDKNYLRVAWTIEDTNEDLTQYRFTVFRSESPEGPWKIVQPDLANTFEVFDRTVDLHSKIRQHHYKVIVVNLETDEEAESEVRFMEEPRGADLILLEIRRRNEELLLPRFTGTRVAFFVEKTFGQKCDYCWDELAGRQRSSKCLQCFNTSYVGGYENQITGWANWTPPASIARMTELGEDHPITTPLWTGHYPKLKPRDMIIEQSGVRWRVVSVNFTEKRRITGHQTVQVVRIPTGDIEYRVPVEDMDIPSDVFKGFYPPGGSGLL